MEAGGLGFVDIHDFIVGFGLIGEMGANRCNMDPYLYHPSNFDVLPERGAIFSHDQGRLTPMPPCQYEHRALAVGIGYSDIHH